MTDYKQMPEPVKQRTGCKVGWHYYATLEEATAAAEVAAHNRELQLNRGYDFGYCWPGSIDGPMEEGEYAGLYEVCTP